MKRDWDLIRIILLKLEEKPEPKSILHDTAIKGYDSETVAYHYKLLHSAGLIEGQDWSSLSQLSYSATSLTWQGHEFLDKIKNETVWNGIKSTVKTKSLDLSFEVIKSVGATLIRAMLP